ncbi:MAG: hypothetical protein FJ197_11540 [Gammaproteobacteria bacterium]|nr:hypothetical protein [Gammaproteobacteria bacterium]
MNRDLIFWPILVQIALTLILYVRLDFAKKKASAAGEVDENRRALYADAWPEYVVQINNCIRNQFEVPILFYVLVALLHAKDSVGAMALVLAWLFVALRLGHAYVHTGSNYVPVRRKLFMGSVVAVVGLFVLAIRALI